MSACWRKLRKNVYFQYSKFQKGHNSHKNWRKMTTLKLDLKCSKTKSYAKWQLNISKHVEEKCGKLADGDPDGRTETRTDRHHHTIICPVWRRAYKKLKEIDDVRTWSNVHKKKVTWKISAQYVKACRRKVRKTVTDGRWPGRTDITIP